MANVRAQLETFLSRRPVLGRGVYVARGAVLVGDVTVGERSSIWYQAVLRGDINRIVVGHHTNLQDGTVVHLADDFPCLIGSYVTVGHAALVHACTVEDECLIGMGAILLDGCVIGRQSIVGAGALVTQGTKIPPGSLVVGAPARVARKLSAAERARLKGMAEKYAQNAAYHLEQRVNVAPRPRKRRAAT